MKIGMYVCMYVYMSICVGLPFSVSRTRSATQEEVSSQGRVGTPIFPSIFYFRPEIEPQNGSPMSPLRSPQGVGGSSGVLEKNLWFGQLRSSQIDSECRWNIVF